MTASGEMLKSAIPDLDDHVFSYITGVLESSLEDFENPDDVYEAVGGVLLEVSKDSQNEEDIRDLCEKLFALVRGDQITCIQRASGASRTLDKPMSLKDSSRTGKGDSEIYLNNTAWGLTRDFGINPATKVNQKKLEKAEAKQKEKQDKRSSAPVKAAPTSATAGESQVSQAFSKKETRLEAKGTNSSLDIRIQNFDVSYGDRVLLQGADLNLPYGRRYGLVGRNGVGKTTLLRMIASRQLFIPSHIRVLHVEQEVVGDETPALESVLECDVVRFNLLKEEKGLNERLQASGGNADSQISTRLGEIYAELQSIEADKAPSRASVILSGLGFSTEMQTMKTKQFSGGWRMRLALARALFAKPDLLLLDEPTNMLDMKAVIWLERYMQTWTSSLLVVSHDRHFLDCVPTDILFLNNRLIDCYRGNYSSFTRVKEEKMKNQLREYEAQQQLRAHVQLFIDRFRYNANRASLVQSKIKMLEKLPELQPIDKDSDVTLKFPVPEKLSPPVLRLDEVSFSYVAGRPVLNNVNLSTSLESRICIVGENGAGKTTLLKILIGELAPVKGIRLGHRNLRVGYFSQHHVDQLDMNISALELMAQRYPGRPTEEYRQKLGSFGITGDLALQQVATLSGGQKSRVAFTIISAVTPNFLVLDEPTNHLDVETVEALGEALAQYKGGVVLVSHDDHLIRSVCKELWVCGEGSVKSIEGGFDEYRRIVEMELEMQKNKK